MQKSKSTLNLQGHIFDLDEVNKEAAHHLMDMIFQKQEQGEKCNSASYDKIILTEEGDIKRISYRVKVIIDVEDFDYGN